MVIAIYAYNKISAINELWIDFGTGKNRKMISMHEMVENIPESIAQNLPFFSRIHLDVTQFLCIMASLNDWHGIHG